MKAYALVFVLLFTAHLCRSQDKPEDLMGQYFWTSPVTMQSCDITGGADPNGNVLQVSYRKQYFDVVNVVDGSVIIQIVDYKAGSSLIPVYTFHEKGTDKYSPGSPLHSLSEFGGNQFYFKVPVATFKKFSAKNEMIKGSAAVGVLTYPFKFRGQKNNKDFSGSFNFGAAIGYTFPYKAWRKFTWSVITGYSISSITLDTASVSRNEPLLQGNNNFTAFSTSVGVLFTYDRKVQAGVFIGTDILNKLTDQTYDWYYQGKPWFSVGFGYSIFSFSTAKENTKSEQDSK